MMYEPLKTFTIIAIPPTIVGLIVIIRYLAYVVMGNSAGHIQSLILGCTLIIMGFMALTTGLIGDLIAKNRKLLEDIEYHTRKMDYDGVKNKEENTMD